MIIRRIEPEDAGNVSALIVRTLREVNTKDYSREYIENDVQKLQPKDILERAKWTHFYVVCDEDKIVGCGAIGPYWGKVDESSLFTIFVLPEYHGQGIGRKIIDTLEKDEYFLRANRIEIPASITATPFYIKMGYTYKNGISVPDEECRDVTKSEVCEDGYESFVMRGCRLAAVRRSFLDLCFLYVSSDIR